MAEATLHRGDCLVVMRELLEQGHDASFDAVVTDAPYHLTTGKRGGTGPATLNLKHRAGRARIGTGGGFMGSSWDGGDIAFQAKTWEMALALLKPGGHLLAFGGARTYHRLACAVEDAGFEIRDQIMWVFGSGMSKVGYIRNADGSHVLPGFGGAQKPAHEPIVVARKPLIGTIAENLRTHGTGAINIDGCRVVGDGGRHREGEDSQNRRYTEQGGTDFALKPGPRGGDPKGRWPSNFIHDGSDEVLAAFPNAPGQQRTVRGDQRAHGTKCAYGAFGDTDVGMEPRNDSGSAARFFYCAKANAAERAGSRHPTVKPLALMRYLCRLVTPPGGVILDPFCGSGTTLEAALLEGFNAVGIEMTAEFWPDIDARIRRAKKAA